MADGRTAVGFDGTPASWRALDWAVARVAQRGGRLDIVRAVDRSLAETLLGRDADIVGSVEEELRRAARHARAGAPEAYVTARWVDGSAVEVLLNASTTASVLVVGTDRRADGTGARIGSLPLRLAAAADCVVAVIPDLPPTERRAVVVGVDDSGLGRSALALAVTEASWSGAEVEAVHAWDVPETFAHALSPGDRIDPAFVARQERVVSDAVADVPIARNAPVVLLIERRNPAEALVEHGRGAIALVVGTRGRGRLAASMLGSVSHDVLLNIPCPVLVTPHAYDGFVPAEAEPEEILG